MKKIFFLVLAMIAFSGCDKANSAECPDIEYQQFGGIIKMRARDDISIHNIIINRGNCLYFSRLPYTRNGVDKIQFFDKPLTSDMVESIKDENDKEQAYKELNSGPKKLPKSIDLKFGEEGSIWLLRCKPLEVVLETNLGQCEYKF